MTNKQLTARLATLAAVATLGVTSVFAESRPSNETRRRAEIRRERTTEARRGDDSRNRIERRRSVEERRRADDNRGRGDSRSYRNNDRRGGGDSRSYRNNDRRGQSSYRSREPYRAHGRITNVRRHGHGYRVFVHGARYPFFIPAAHYHRDRFRVGLVISLGGFYNPGGYYDYYDYGRGYSAGALRGVVESVDYRRDTFVVRNDATGSFVTVVNRDRRRNVRAGDYVEVYGDWSRSGVFQARDVDLLGYGR